MELASDWERATSLHLHSLRERMQQWRLPQCALREKFVGSWLRTGARALLNPWIRQRQGLCKAFGVQSVYKG